MGMHQAVMSSLSTAPAGDWLEVGHVKHNNSGVLDWAGDFLVEFPGEIH